MSTKVRRLYENFHPEHYDLQLTIDPDGMTFEGNVVIKGKKAGRPAQRLTFHQKGLKITEASVRRSDKKGEKTFEVTRINNQDSFDEVRIHCDEMLYPGDYDVMLRFEGQITRNMEGIYPCYFEQDGTEQKLIATQFESHHAREAFPCIDEPEAKATFDLRLKAPEAQAVLANTPVVDQSKDKDGLIITRFETTPRMSTYLLAFVWGDMGYLETTTRDGVLVRTYATKDNVEHTRFALDIAVKCLEFYNDYFDIAYPLEKCDFIALPDFASGAMENWGCITFREQALLVDPKNTSLPMKQYVANVIAHELTHQWFGNLVTMRWWNDLWLNESFASWMSYLAVNHIFPEWKVWEDFIVSEQSQALKLDALDNTHPIDVTINHPDEIRTIFDAISYEKGASVILMLREYLGDKAFRDGLRIYLKRHAYQNTVSTDLWSAWEEASGKPVKDFMGVWTTLPGFPVVRASVDQKDLHLHQERFYLIKPDSVSKDVWPIPLDGSTIAPDATLAESQQTIAVIDPDNLVLNRGHSGFYRVVYDSAQITRLKQMIKDDKLAPLDRLGLLSDSIESAKAGYASTTDTLELLEAYQGETNTFVWEVMAGLLGTIRHTMRDDELREAMKPFGRELAAGPVARLGWDAHEGESHFDTLLRPTSLGVAAVSDDKAVVDEALRRFNDMQKPEDVAPDIRGIVYTTAARKGATAEFDKLLKMHNASKSSEDRLMLAGALTAFEQPELIERALELIPGKDVRLQDAAYWVAYSFGNRHARDLTWDWMVAHWDWLQKNMGGDLSFYRMPNYAARNYSDASFLPTFRDFFESHMSTAFERPVKQAIETIEWQSAWRTRDLESIKRHFSKSNS